MDASLHQRARGLQQGWPLELALPNDAQLRAPTLAEQWRLWWRVSRALLETLAGTVAVWIERHRQRRDLAALEPYLLRDLGLTREQALYEASKPFWREGLTWQQALCEARRPFWLE